MRIDDYALVSGREYFSRARLASGQGQNFEFGIAYLIGPGGTVEVTKSGVPLPANVGVRDLDLLFVTETGTDATIEPVASKPARPIGLLSPATGLILPAQVGDWGLTGTWEEFDRRELGMAASFGHPSDRVATLYVYNLGMKEIPEGAESDIVLTHVTDTEDDIMDNPEIDVWDEPGRTVCRFGPAETPVDWLVSNFAADTLVEGMLRFWILLTGWENHFIKVRVTDPTDVWEPVEPDSVLQELVDGISLDLASC